jgi:hypothetical protein
MLFHRTQIAVLHGWSSWRLGGTREQFGNLGIGDGFPEKVRIEKPTFAFT